MGSRTFRGPIGRISGSRRFRPTLFGALGLSALLLAGCSAAPPPPVRASESVIPATPQRISNTAIAVAIDGLGLGRNPHLQSDQSLATWAISKMTLPSAFDFGDDGVAVRNADLLESAEVVSPTELRYVIRPDAQWSDGAPIAAEDFSYLWEQVLTHVDTVDSALYAKVREIRAGAGGKEVRVELSEPVANWEALFQYLLPSHLLKITPGGFENAMRGNAILVGGGQFQVTSVNTAQDEVVLARNDRFWGAPSAADEVRFRRAGSPALLANSLRTDDAQLAVVSGAQALRGQLDAISGVHSESVANPRTLSLTLNTRSPLLADVALRRALFGVIDQRLARSVGADGSDVDIPADAVTIPSDPVPADPSDPASPEHTSSSAPTTLSAPDPARARATLADALAAAGYVRDDSGTFTRGGVALRLSLGALSGDGIGLAVARNISDQLGALGIGVDVAAVDPDELTGSLTEAAEAEVPSQSPSSPDPTSPNPTSPNSSPPSPATTSPAPTSPPTTTTPARPPGPSRNSGIDALVHFRDTGGDSAIRLATFTGCRAADPAVPPESSGAPGSTDATASASVSTSPDSSVPDSSVPDSSVPDSSTPDSSTPGSSVPDSSSSLLAPTLAALPFASNVDAVGGNLSGICDRELDAIGAELIGGRGNRAELLARAADLLEAAAVTLPLYRERQVVAVGPDVVGVVVTGGSTAMVFSNAGSWERTR